MSIKITISDHVAFKVTRVIVTETGAAETGDFWITARRLDAESFSEAIADQAQRLNTFLADIVTNWRGVLDDQGSEVPYSSAALAQLLRTVGMAPLIFRTYCAEVGAKEKN